MAKKVNIQWYQKEAFQTALLNVIPAFLVAVIGIWIQAYYANKQLEISNIQNINTTKEKAKLDSLQVKKDRVSLIITCWNIMEAFPADGVSAFDSYNISRKNEWAKAIITLFESELQNEVLLQDEEAMDRWLNVINLLRMTLLMISGDMKKTKEWSKEEKNKTFRQCALEVHKTYVFVESRIGDKSFIPVKLK